MEQIFNQFVDLVRYWVIQHTVTQDPVLNNSIGIAAGLAISYIATQTKTLSTSVAERVMVRVARRKYVTGPLTDEQRVQREKLFPRPATFTVMAQTSDPRLMNDVTRWAMRTYPVTRFSSAVFTTLRGWGTQTQEQGGDTMVDDNDDTFVDQTRVTFDYFAAWQAFGDVLYVNYNTEFKRIEFLCQNAECLRSFQSNFKDPSPEEIAAIATKTKAEEAAREAREAADAKQRADEQARLDAEAAEAAKDASIVIGKYKLPPKAALGEQRYSVDLIKLYRAQKLSIKDARKIDRRWTLDAMVFPEKIKLLSLVRNFRRSIASPDPYACSKIGVMSAGSPGTGKSTVATAIANTLGYNIATADLSDPDLDADEFAKAIDFATSLNFVIEFAEFDKLLINMRTQVGSPEQRAMRYKEEVERARVVMEQLKDAGDEAAADKAKANYVRLLQQDRKQPIDLGVLQGILDGQGASTGRIIVASTNVPRDIPSALMREGRFDIKLEMVNMTADGIRELLRLIYGWQSDPELPGVPSTPDLIKLSPEDEENEIDNPDYFASRNKAKRQRRWNKLRTEALEDSAWKISLAADFEWLDTLVLPSGLWSPAQVVSAHRTHLQLRATALHLANERPVEFCATYLREDVTTPSVDSVATKLVRSSTRKRKAGNSLDEYSEQESRGASAGNTSDSDY